MARNRVCCDGNVKHIEDHVGRMLVFNLCVGCERDFLFNKFFDEDGVRFVVGGGLIRRFPFTSVIFVYIIKKCISNTILEKFMAL